MNIEDLIKKLKTSDPSIRLSAMKKIADIASKTSNKKEVRVLYEALKYAFHNDPSEEIRNSAGEKLKKIKRRLRFFSKSSRSRNRPVKFSYAKILLAILLLILIVAMIPYIKQLEIFNSFKVGQDSLDRVDVGSILSLKNIEEVRPPEMEKGVNLCFRPGVGATMHSRIVETNIQRSGGKEINSNEIRFDLKRRVRKLLPGGRYVVEYRTSNVKSSIPIRNIGFPDPGKKLIKTFRADGRVEEISGDLYGIVPAFAFINRYIFPDRNVKPGKSWKSDVERSDVRSEALYRLEKIVEAAGHRFFYITYKSSSKLDSISYRTTINQRALGEIFLDYFSHSPVYLKEVSMINLKKPDSHLGVEIKTVRTETFSTASVLKTK